MMRVLIALLLMTVTADAMTRVRITAPTSRSNAEIICPWVAWSVPPDTPNGSISLGVCPNRNTYDYCAVTGRGCPR